MKVAAVQMQADLANIAAYLEKAKDLAKEAFEEGAARVVLPEFFTSVVGFSRKMKNAALPLEGSAMKCLNPWPRSIMASLGDRISHGNQETALIPLSLQHRVAILGNTIKT